MLLPLTLFTIIISSFWYKTHKADITILATVGILGLIYLYITSLDITLNNIPLINGYFTLNTVTSMMALIVYISTVLFLAFTNLNPLLFLFNITNVVMLTRTNDLLALFLLVELQSYSFYLITNDTSKSGALASVIYFVIGSLGTIMILSGISDIYNELGTFSLINTDYPLVGSTLLITGILLKSGYGPIHNWSLEVYWLSSTKLTAWLSLVGKLSFNALLYSLLSTMNLDTPMVIMILLLATVASLVIGALGGLGEPNIKLLLAYSGVFTLGTTVIFLLNSTPEYTANMYIYWLQYSLTHLLIFFVIISYGYYLLDSHSNSPSKLSNNSPVEFISQLHSMYSKNLLLAGSLVFALFSLMGIPPLPGFYAKMSALEAWAIEGHYLIAILLLIGSSFSAVYYANVIKETLGFIPSTSNTIRLQSAELLNKITIYNSTIISTLLITLLVFGLNYNNIYESALICIELV